MKKNIVFLFCIMACLGFSACLTVMPREVGYANLKTSATVANVTAKLTKLNFSPDKATFSDVVLMEDITHSLTFEIEKTVGAFHVYEANQTLSFEFEFIKDHEYEPVIELVGNGMRFWILDVTTNEKIFSDIWGDYTYSFEPKKEPSKPVKYASNALYNIENKVDYAGVHITTSAGTKRTGSSFGFSSGYSSYDYSSGAVEKAQSYADSYSHSKAVEYARSRGY